MANPSSCPSSDDGHCGHQNAARGQRRLGAPLAAIRSFAWAADESASRTRGPTARQLNSCGNPGVMERVLKSAPQAATPITRCVPRQGRPIACSDWRDRTRRRPARGARRSAPIATAIAHRAQTIRAQCVCTTPDAAHVSSARPTIRASMSRATRVILLLKHIPPCQGFRSMRLEDLGLIGNCQFSALVHNSGEVVWCCLPRFDSEPVFSTLLDSQDGGRFRIGPAGGESGTQRYRPTPTFSKPRLQPRPAPSG